jgi:predicted rRNA methylase YqxC with S4 and FtsJ domains
MDNRNIIRTIENESPDTHWGFLPVKDKVVLDLGSGLNSEFMPTPYYFLQECKAKKVYGVDASEQSYTWYKQNFNVQHFIQFMDYVDRVEKFEWYINAAKPDIMKVDVEGSEIFMNAIKPELLKDITNIAVEYHNLPCLLSVEGLFKDNGYKLEYYKFNHLDIDFQGVIHAYKPTNLFVELEKIN